MGGSPDHLTHGVQKIRDAGQPTEWCFVQDLQAINAVVQAHAHSVPNPYTILSQVPPDARWFSVVDLANAFFSIPVHPDSQFWFAFEFKGKNLHIHPSMSGLFLVPHHF